MEMDKIKAFCKHVFKFIELLFLLIKRDYVLTFTHKKSITIVICAEGTVIERHDPNLTTVRTANIVFPPNIISMYYHIFQTSIASKPVSKVTTGTCAVYSCLTVV